MQLGWGFAKASPTRGSMPKSSQLEAWTGFAQLWPVLSLPSISVNAYFCIPRFFYSLIIGTISHY